ncbi:MAG: hypothetical protein O2791_05710 [Bacteroidetes bacterium]|nr:hypothetical protein [Bacteroidota bacterium]
MTALFFAACRVVLGFLAGTGFSWGVGQTLQDLLAPNVPRPNTNDSASLVEFLEALPPLAHAGRLTGLGAGVMLGCALVCRLNGGRPVEAWALAFLFGIGSLADVLRVPSGNALSIATVVLILPAAWMGIRLTSRRF